MSALENVATLIINVVLDAYIFLLMLRLLFQALQAHYANPIVAFVWKLTTPVVRPVQKIVPGFKGIDFAIVLIMLLLEILELILLILIRFHTMPGALGSTIVAIAMLGAKLINIFFFAVIINAIVSWFPSLRHSAVTEVVGMLAEPVSAPVRRVLPLMGGFDLSPIVVLLVLKIIEILVFNPLIAYGLRLALS